MDRIKIPSFHRVLLFHHCLHLIVSSIPLVYHHRNPFLCKHLSIHRTLSFHFHPRQSIERLTQMGFQMHVLGLTAGLESEFINEEHHVEITDLKTHLSCLISAGITRLVEFLSRTNGWNTWNFKSSTLHIFDPWTGLNHEKPMGRELAMRTKSTLIALAWSLLSFYFRRFLFMFILLTWSSLVFVSKVKMVVKSRVINYTTSTKSKCQILCYRKVITVFNVKADG